MSSYLAALAAATSDNWDICVREGLWGSSDAKARSVRAGDELFVFQARAGMRAYCMATTDARPARGGVVPWPQPQEYKWVFGIDVVEEHVPGQESTVPFVDRRNPDTGLHSIQFSQFPALTAAQADYFRSHFGPPPAVSQVEAQEPSSGWGSRQDQERNKQIEQAAVDAALAYLLRIGLTYVADRQRDGVGYDFDFSDRGTMVHVEVKGISASIPAFNMTAKEVLNAQQDPAFRLVAVTNALGSTPQIHDMLGPELFERFELTPFAFRAVRRLGS